ncbi:MAG: septum formation initiator family protein [Chitinophagaceae bacterium]|jgi:cell division protein FtsB|nr:septum formation initiator family protein [Chitinophagaceae bacterium]
MRILKGVIRILRNKYLVALSVFLLWVLFFDSRDIFTQLGKRAELNSLLESKRFYENEIALAKKQLADIQTSAAALEKIARERYKMKRPNEDLFLVEEP